MDKEKKNNVYEVILIANFEYQSVNQKTNCYINEYLPIDEFNYIYQELVNSDYFIKDVFLNEKELIKHLSKSKKNTIVIKIAKNKESNFSDKGKVRLKKLLSAIEGVKSCVDRKVVSSKSTIKSVNSFKKIQTLVIGEWKITLGII